jgi:O-antigen/teichoic acid export membrane protein
LSVSKPSFENASEPAPDVNAPRIGAGALSGFVALTAGVIATLITTPIVLHALGSARFGLWVALVAAVSFTGLLDFGFSQAVARFIGEHRARHDSTAVEAFIIATGASYLAAFGLVLLATAAIGAVFPLIVHVPSAEHGAVLAGAMLVGLATALGMWMGFFGSILHAHQRLLHANIVRAGYWVGFTLLTVIVALSGWGIVGLAAAMAASAGLSCVAFLVLLRRALPELRIRRPQGTYLRQAARYSFFMFMVSAGAALIFEADTLVIAGFLGAAAVTSYAIALRLTRGVTGFIHKVPDVLFPFYAGMQASGDRRRLRENYLLSARLELIGAATVLLGLVFAWRPLIAAWVGASYVVGFAVFALALTLLLFESLVHPAAVLAAATGGERRMAMVNTVEAVINLGLSIAFVVRFGLVGVIAATVLAQALTNLWFLPVWAMRSLRLSMRQYAAATLARAVVPACAGGITGLLLAQLVRSDLGLVAAGAAAAGVCTGVYLRIGAGVEERGWLRGLRAATLDVARKPRRAA